MSLTSFLENPTLRAKFKAEFSKPEFRYKGSKIKAPPLTGSHSLVGTAFDYLLRFYVQKLNPCTQAQRWLAEDGLLSLDENDPIFNKANRMFADAKERYENFIASRRQRPTKELAEAAVRLAYFDVIVRAGIVDPNAFKKIPPLILDDLEAMLRLVRAEDFRAKKRCMLNPTFGSGSLLVGGADADLIIDDTLIDIKSIKRLAFDRRIFNQLIGYYVLSCIGSISNYPRGAINFVGVYYARYGILHRTRISECVVKSRMPTFLRWFEKQAREELRLIFANSAVQLSSLTLGHRER
jgi:hypothetical protein